MIRRRNKPDGLPFRVYERHGTRDYSIGLKASDGKWAWRLKCKASDEHAIARTRADAIRRATNPSDVTLPDSFGALIDDWFDYQDRLPATSTRKRAASTLKENEREAKSLRATWGTWPVVRMEAHHAYEFLDTAELAGRAEKGNKEFALARLILEYGVRRGVIKSNPFRGIEVTRVIKAKRLVSAQEMDLALDVGRRMGGVHHIVALGLRTAYLAIRRSVEVRAIVRSDITSDGLMWRSGKSRAGAERPQGLIEWSDALRATIDEALAIKRHKSIAASWYVFGSLAGQRYSKANWGKHVRKLMAECSREAAARGLAFQRFSLQDCRPRGVTSKLEKGHRDVLEATGHTNERMIQQTYDRRQIKRAKPAE